MLELPGTPYCKAEFSVVNNLEKLKSFELKFSMLSFSLGMTFFLENFSKNSSAVSKNEASDKHKFLSMCEKSGNIIYFFLESSFFGAGT